MNKLRLLSIMIITFTLVMATVSPSVYSAITKMDSEKKSFYEGNNHVGTVYVNLGSPDVSNGIIVLYVDKSAPVNPDTQRVSAYRIVEGSSWTEYWLIFPVAIYDPENHIKTYRDYYVSSKDPEWSIAFLDPARYDDNGNKNFNMLEEAVKIILNILWNEFNIPGPSPIDLLYGLIERDSSSIFSGVQTPNLRVSLRTETRFLPVYHVEYSDYGTVRNVLKFFGAGNWANNHNSGYFDWINFDVVYKVEWGAWVYYLDEDRPPSWLSFQSEVIRLRYVNVKIVLSD